MTLAIAVDATLITQFFRFAAVGVLGFVVNLGSVYLLRGDLGLYLAGAAGFMTAASVTWVVNRAWTFSDRARVAAPRQWLQYLGANLFGFGLYYATYGGLIAVVPLCRIFPVLPVGAGSVVGLFANFTLSRRLVFRSMALERRVSRC